MHIPSRTGEWGQTSIANIINNEVYLGKIRWRREPVKRVVKDGMLAKKRILNDEYEIYEGRHEPIITEEQWNMAKAAQKKRNHTPNHKERQLRNSFASILVCGKCGAIMKRKTPKKSRSCIPWYQCPTRGCDCKMIKCDTVENYIQDAMEEWLEEYILQINSEQQPSIDPVASKLCADSLRDSSSNKINSVNTWKKEFTLWKCLQREMPHWLQILNSFKLLRRNLCSSKTRGTRRKNPSCRLSPPPSIFWIITIFSPFWKRISYGTGYTPETAEEYLAEAIGIRARQTEVIIDRDEDDKAIVEEIVPDGMGNLHHVIHSNRFGKAIRQSFEKLPWLEQTILKARNAICDDCGGVMPWKEQYSYREISLLNGTTTDKAGELAYHAAVDLLAKQMIEDEVFRIVDLVLEEPKRPKKKNAAATYLYQADCDGEWSEIYIDFENKRVNILRLADWDLTKSHIYARTAIRYLIFTGGRNLPKKRRIIFEPQRPPRRQHKRNFRVPNTDIAGCQKEQEIIVAPQGKFTLKCRCFDGHLR